jgi:hypothetical protein
MNPYTNEFEPVTEETPPSWKRFTVGEEVRLKGLRFQVEAVEPKRLLLSPLPVDGANRKERRTKDALRRKPGKGSNKMKPRHKVLDGEN